MPPDASTLTLGMPENSKPMVTTALSPKPIQEFLLLGVRNVGSYDIGHDDEPGHPAMIREIEGDVVEGLVAYGTADALPAEKDYRGAYALGLQGRAAPYRVLIGLVEARRQEADDRRLLPAPSHYDPHRLRG